ncbi:MAG: hypothetical protein LBF85_08095 [Tannerella sp.]|jgi:hypothetical protein|nr:hypothetical protein [Tannerella sp.]
MVARQLFSLHREFPGGGKIEIMEGYVKKSDHKELLAIARYFAEKGDRVQITTGVHFKDEKYRAVFGRLDGTPYERKCPDLIIGGRFYEYESFVPPFKREKTGNMLSKGLKQSSRVIINNNKGASERYIRRNIHERGNFKQDIKEVWLYEKGKVRLLYKKQ